MQLKSTTTSYGTVAVVLHWLSALLILGMIPLGFLMQRADEGTQLLLYRMHVAVGAVVLLLTLARVTWKLFDTRVLPVPGLAGVHVWGMIGIHGLLYLGLLALLVSGVILNVQSGLIEVIQGSSIEAIPDLSGFTARAAHGNLARIYIGLLIAHIGGVIVHQVRYGHVLVRMGIGTRQPAAAISESGADGDEIERHR
ncbi:MAG: cytochrome b/b6 domain-containing protein [Planctomycetaceae bacterium]|nr:cytochrome b/b6 domain-containing protein [Planctomycetaceae bacterium]